MALFSLIAGGVALGGSIFNFRNQNIAAREGRRMSALAHNNTMFQMGIQGRMASMAFAQAKNSARFFTLQGQAKQVAAKQEGMFLELDAVLNAQSQIEQFNQIKKEGADFMSAQVGAVVKRGIDVSGSALEVINETREGVIREKENFVRNTKLGLRIGKIKSDIVRSGGRASAAMGQLQNTAAMFEAGMARLGSELGAQFGRSQSTFRHSSAIISSRTQQQQAFGGLIRGAVGAARIAGGF